MDQPLVIQGLELPRPPGAVVLPGEFVFAAAFLDHGHIYGQCQGLVEAGAVLKWIWDPSPEKRAALLKAHPGAREARSYDEILGDPSVHLVTTAAVPNVRAVRSIEALRAGKHVLADKPPFTSFEQLVAVRKAVAETGRIFAVYYSERLHNEAAMAATEVVKAGLLGRVLQVIGLGPHREGKGRPDWFYRREEFGGILCDIGSHQFEQFLTFASADDATVVHAAVANHAHPQAPTFEDFGEANLLAPNGARNYVRVDWFTPPGLSTWGDGRTLILGDRGYLELRKYVDIARSRTGDQLYLVDDKGEHHFETAGRVGFRFFGELIRDCREGTQRAMAQAHTFRAAELALRAQARANGLLLA